MGYRAVVCDVDGTITDPSKIIQTLGIEVLRKAQDRGRVVILASGNVLPVVYGLSTFIGLRGPVVAENGGIVSYQDEVHTLFSNEVPLQAYEHLRTVMPGVRRLFTDQWRRTEVGVNREADLTEVLEALRDWPLEVEATGFAIHLMQRGHSKMAGVRKACELIGVDVSEVVAFGDADNDALMLKECGYGVAVGNASDKARKAADLVTKGKHAEGVREGLISLGLI
ncbi:MAG TPA: phosphoglycolate phosphatase [Methanomassiliicoccales archaeon]|nr:phosphoglycolate phosphatase [Methanomassiliicoccales archaeon]HPR97822.1 phosphoglycolate phosphatase [Methanomassiliicoccales archaeon]